MSDQKKAPAQLELPLSERAVSRAPFKLIKGGGQRKQEPLKSRDAVVRVLVEAGADLLLRRISPERAEEIEKRVDRVLDLFDRVDARPEVMILLERELNELEVLMTQTREKRVRRAP